MFFRPPQRRLLRSLTHAKNFFTRPLPHLAPNRLTTIRPFHIPNYPSLQQNSFLSDGNQLKLSSLFLNVKAGGDGFDREEHRWIQSEFEKELGREGEEGEIGDEVEEWEEGDEGEEVEFWTEEDEGDDGDFDVEGDEVKKKVDGDEREKKVDGDEENKDTSWDEWTTTIKNGVILLVIFFALMSFDEQGTRLVAFFRKRDETRKLKEFFEEIKPDVEIMSSGVEALIAFYNKPWYTRMFSSLQIDDQGRRSR